MCGRVVKRKCDSKGIWIGQSHVDPLHDTSLYDVMLNDGNVELHSSNLNADNIYKQIDLQQ